LKGGGRITERQKRFAEEYVKRQDAAEAYIAAGYKNSCDAKRKGDELKENPEVGEYIKELSKKDKPFLLDSDSVLSLLGTIAFSSPADFGDIEEVDGEQKFIWKDLSSLDVDLKRTIASIKNTKGGIEIETASRQ